MRYVTSSVLDGSVEAPPSKSFMQRATAAALLCSSATEIVNASTCDDARHALRLVRDLGAEVRNAGTDASGRLVSIRGGAVPDSGRVRCGESGLCLRLFTPILALFRGPFTLGASGSLLLRPAAMMERPLAELGALCRTKDGRPPVEVRGPLAGGRAEVDGSVSSQFLSGLLLALPLAEKRSEIAAKGLKSRAYVEMTLDVVRAFGGAVDASPDLAEFRIEGGQSYRAGRYWVEGDWSGAAAILAAGALAGRVEVTGLNRDSVQPDRAVLRALERAGAKVRVSDERVVVERAELKPFDFDVAECPDIFPPLAALAARCEGTSRIRGIERLRHKESARDLVVVEEFAELGVRVELDGGVALVHGGRIRGGRAGCRGDHRIAMALALAGLVAEAAVGIAGASCVTKSYPRFFEDLERLGGRVS